MRALAPFYDLTSARLFRYALTITRNRHDAEDVVQQAIVQLALHPQGVADALQPWAYCLTVLRNEALRVVRKRPVTTVMADSANPLETEDPSGFEVNETVAAALATLPASQAEVVALKVWEQMTFAEIAEVLGQSPNTVASRYRYALEKLTKQLQPLRDRV